MIQFDLLNDARWQAKIEEKQGRFRLDRYRPFAFQNGSMVYNTRDHNWIPNAADNPWANCPSKDSEHEYHVMHTLTWSLQSTKITPTFDINTGQRHIFATLKNQNVISLFQCKVVSSSLYVLENQQVLINKSHSTQTAMTHIA